MLQDLGIELLEINLLPVKEEGPFTEPKSLINQILTANKDSKSLTALQIQAESAALGEYTLEDRLLLYTGRLVVPATLNNLYIELIQEAYNQISTVYLEKDKTYQLLQLHYYQLDIQLNIKRYIYNCYTY